MVRLPRELEALRLANPVQLDAAAEHAAILRLRERMLERRADSDAHVEPRRDHRVGSRRARIGGFAAAAAATLAVLLATPALGRLRDALPFWSARKAPPSVILEFSSMNTGAPTGMSPQAISTETRKVGDFQFGGTVHPLWVAPTKTGNFCFEWIGGWGGCTSGPSDVLTWNGDLVVPHDAPALTIPPGATPSQITAFANARHGLAVPTWLSGYVLAGKANRVRITFSDGRSVSPEVTWVSEPINAGFFAYDVPSNLRLHADHVTKVEALTANGTAVASQPTH
jgi:hypothetical protein